MGFVLLLLDPTARFPPPQPEVMGWGFPINTPWTPSPFSSCRLVLIWEGAWML